MKAEQIPFWFQRTFMYVVCWNGATLTRSSWAQVLFIYASGMIQRNWTSSTHKLIISFLYHGLQVPKVHPQLFQYCCSVRKTDRYKILTITDFLFSEGNNAADRNIIIITIIIKYIYIALIIVNHS